MTFRKCNPLYGYGWLRAGIRLFLAQPWPWLALVGLSFLGALVLLTLPVLGPLALFALLPGVSAGLQMGAFAASRQEPLFLPYLVAGLRKAPRPLVLVGITGFFYTLGVMGMLMAGWGEELGKLFELMQSAAPDPGLVEATRATLIVPSLVSLALMLPLTMASWFAPALIVFRGEGARSAMILSFQACLRNFWPFAVYGALLFLLDAVVSLVLGAALQLLDQIAGQTFTNAIAMTIAFPVVCAFFAIIAASQYASFGEVFAAEAAPADTQG